MDPRRVRQVKKVVAGRGPVVYWMSREQRTADNWGLLFAQECSRRQNTPLIVVFCLVPKFLDATLRHYKFMIQGLGEVAEKLTKKNIPFMLRCGDPIKEIPEFVTEQKASTLVVDFDSLRVKQAWLASISAALQVDIYEVDSRNVIPCWITSQKQEFAAYTIRPKIHLLLEDFLTEFPPLQAQPETLANPPSELPRMEHMTTLRVNGTDDRLYEFTPGETAATTCLHEFLRYGLTAYPETRNNPNQDGQSGLSPFLHFGQISAQRIALQVERAEAPQASKDAFLEELIVRRELAENYCYYNRFYDQVAGFPEWAQKTLAQHKRDHREFLYTLKDLETADTHDPLWNAAQREMVNRGKMHGYLRMYWAKKILEWTETPEHALAMAVFLNDRYELDGRDPNGYTGIAWSIGGVHDRAWGERPIFGKIRFMSYAGAKSKFNIAKYIQAGESDSGGS